MRYMKKYYVSDYWNKGIKGHLNYAFVDVVVNDDKLNCNPRFHTSYLG